MKNVIRTDSSLTNIKKCLFPLEVLDVSEEQSNSDISRLDPKGPFGNIPRDFDKVIDSFGVLPKFKVLWLNSKRCLLYSKGKLYVAENLTDQPQLVGSIPMNWWQRLFSQLRLTERALRLEPRGTVAIDDSTYLVSCLGRMFCVDLRRGSVTVDHYYRHGMNNPLGLSIIEGIYGFEDCIAYGEYWGNCEKEPVAVYARKKGRDSWEKVYSFPEKQVLHIHAVIPDPFRNGVLILTGDNDDESGIWLATDNFATVTPLIKGGQGCRACVAFPTAQGILFATDSPLEKNAICMASEGADGWISRPLRELPGPCIYGTRVGNRFLFSTSVEPDSRIKGLGYLLTYRLGKGVEDRRCYVLVGDAERGFFNIASFRKDLLPMGLFQFGSVQFPAGEMDDYLVMYPSSVVQHDGNTLFVKTLEL